MSDEYSNRKIPAFEGQDVAFTKAKLTSVAGLEINDEVLRMDGMVRMYIEGRVTRIDHVVNERTGALERLHTIKAIDCELLPYEKLPGVSTD